VLQPPPTVAGAPLAGADGSTCMRVEAVPACSWAFVDPVWARETGSRHKKRGAGAVVCPNILALAIPFQSNPPLSELSILEKCCEWILTDNIISSRLVPSAGKERTCDCHEWPSQRGSSIGGLFPSCTGS
jgi:hypothetical protein